MIRLKINGTEQPVQAGTVAKVVDELGLPGPLLLVEHNGTALRKSEWEQTALQEGDCVEILRISAGG